MALTPARASQLAQKLGACHCSGKCQASSLDRGASCKDEVRSVQLQRIRPQCAYHGKLVFQELDGAAGSPGCCMAFLEALADAASHMLASLDVTAVKLCDYMAEAEGRFSCQVCATKCAVWS
eukprot:1155728-Pelagomonas_calceolata.AAC.6